MCNQKKIYRLSLHSADAVSGDTTNATFLVRLPYKVAKGSLYLESATFQNAGTFLNGVSSLKISVPSFPQKYHYYSDGRNYSVVSEIPLQLNYIQATTLNVMYKDSFSLNSAGFQVENLDLDNKEFQIQIRDETDAIIPTARLTGFTMTFLIVDDEPNNIDY